MGIWENLLNWLRSLFFKQEMELSLIGLQGAGKTSLVNVIATGGYSEDMIPTIGFNMRKVTKGNVTIKLWDLGGQPRFRSMWERYCRAVSAITLLQSSLINLWSSGKIEIPINKLFIYISFSNIVSVYFIGILNSDNSSFGSWLPVVCCVHNHIILK
ncbi:hypothetical protein MKW94_030760 [Papaver nudicaule]|uniref:ADP-ribosylation factor-like protein 8A n=1 Tax=Papaver nudicaule TaxID=74823 RepID=A0AA41RUS7_PAPNU|nr:hypothetical protein [Papaver nudicaule]